MEKLKFVPVLVFLSCILVFAQKPAVDSVALAKDSLAKTATVPVSSYGRMNITTVPDSAEVSVDSIARGIGKVSVDSLLPGQHVIVVKHKGYFGKKVTFDVVPDSTLSVDVVLVKPSVVVVNSQPAGARIIMDGKEAGVTPFANAKVKPGEHIIRAEKESYFPIEKVIICKEGEVDTLSINLQSIVIPAAPVSPAPQKTGIDSIILITVAGLFLVFGIIILGVEASSN